MLHMQRSSPYTFWSHGATKGWQYRNKYQSHAHKQTSSQNVKSNVRCIKCKLYGHFMNKCKNTPKGNESNGFSAVSLSGNFNQTDWYVDSGASCHLISKKDWLLNTTNQHQVQEIIIADKTRISVEGYGDVQISTVVGDTEHENTVMGVLYVQNLATNLLSVSKLISKGNKVTFDEKHCYIYNQKSELVATADLVGGVYKLRIKQIDCLLTSVSGSVWHRRFGHLNSKDLNGMRNGAVKGM
ncbi:Retrovirus-related Pol polyprotein from transposon TNT 1-94 [Eumeta japonica]|uniref:Retrovirus-related Pol polyprotein from transposon TNT 1-94 n=1 Tax=Eumeta variegata TaxID=151549 RepID=A0A4C2A6V2_EUMVA|nr:Retrovirus-related Pol polyprotein from transposon TNT 1-94 [Eumeta japonica]